MALLYDRVYNFTFYINTFNNKVEAHAPSEEKN